MSGWKVRVSERVSARKEEQRREWTDMSYWMSAIASARAMLIRAYKGVKGKQ